MTVAILGASGLVGKTLSHYLTQKNIPWLGTYRRSPVEGGVYLDDFSTESLLCFFQNHTITSCVNCIAERNVEYCEKNKDTIFEINTLFARQIAEACKQSNIYLLHISTDYVFDGSAHPYYPDTRRYPIQMYGKSKMQGEDEILRLNKDACIVRVPALYSNIYTSLSDSVVSVIGKKVMDRTRKYMEDNYFVRRPLLLQDACAFFVSCIQHKKSGIFHFYSSKTKTSKYKMALEIGKYLGISTNHILPDSSPCNTVGRPYDTQLLDTGYDRTAFPDTSFSDGIAASFAKFKHPTLSWNEAPSSPIFFMIDLDGTLVDTEYLHYTAYKRAFEEHGYMFCDWEKYQQLPSLETYCKETLGDSYPIMKQTKQTYLQESTIEFLPGAEAFLHWLFKYNQNFVIVTNTGKETVEFYKMQLPLLQKVTQWITRENVTYPKPDPEAYRTAKEQYWKGEACCIGFENTVGGYLSLSSITSIIYILCKSDSYTHTTLSSRDIYFIPDFNVFFGKCTVPVENASV